MEDIFWQDKLKENGLERVGENCDVGLILYWEESEHGHVLMRNGFLKTAIDTRVMRRKVLVNLENKDIIDEEK